MEQTLAVCLIFAIVAVKNIIYFRDKDLSLRPVFLITAISCLCGIVFAGAPIKFNLCLRENPLILIFVFIFILPLYVCAIGGLLKTLLSKQ